MDNLVLPVTTYLKNINKECPATMTPDSTLRDLISTLTEHNLHRAFVVNDQGKIVRVVSLGDLLRFLIQ